jgi:hypothetical protein
MCAEARSCPGINGLLGPVDDRIGLLPSLVKGFDDSFAALVKVPRYVFTQRHTASPPTIVPTTKAFI